MPFAIHRAHHAWNEQPSSSVTPNPNAQQSQISYDELEPPLQGSSGNAG